MFYGNTKTLLESIVRGLKTEPPQNEAEWQAQTELVQGCLSEMVGIVGAFGQSVNGDTIRSPSRCR